MKLLALDFDGVIVNSVIDNMLTSYNVYLKFNPHTKIFGAKHMTFENHKEIMAKYPDIVDKFRFYSSFVTKAGQYTVIYYIIEREEKVENIEEFRVFCSNFFDTTFDSFQSEFYVERRRLQMTDMEQWYALSTPFKEAVNQFKLLSEGNEVYIVTGRDSDSIVKLKPKYNLGFIDDSKILDKDAGFNKADKLNSLVEKYKIKKTDIIFVDDILKHVLDVKRAGFNVFMAAWGYNTGKQQEIARKEGAVLLKQEDIYRIINMELSG